MFYRDKIVLVLNWASQHEGVWGNGGITVGILNLGTRWRSAFSIMHWPPYPWQTYPSAHWTASWVNPRADLDVVEKNLLSLLRIEPWFLGHQARSLVTILTGLPQLLISNNKREHQFTFKLTNQSSDLRTRICSSGVFFILSILYLMLKMSPLPWRLKV
jgi:hypothetical protein